MGGGAAQHVNMDPTLREQIRHIRRNHIKSSEIPWTAGCLWDTGQCRSKDAFSVSFSIVHRPVDACLSAGCPKDFLKLMCLVLLPHREGWIVSSLQIALAVKAIARKVSGKHWS